MKKWILVLLLASSSASYADNAARKQWEDKLALLTNGMVQSQVEAIFPMAGAQRLIESAGSYTLIYNVDAETAITLRYDYSGNQMEAHGKTSASQNPDNRLIGTMGLSASKISPPPKTIQKVHRASGRQTHRTTTHKTH